MLSASDEVDARAWLQKQQTNMLSSSDINAVIAAAAAVTAPSPSPNSPKSVVAGATAKTIPSGYIIEESEDTPKSSTSVGTRSAIFSTETLDGWLQPKSAQYAGLMCKSPARGRWDVYQPLIDEAMERFGPSKQLQATAETGNPENLARQVDFLLGHAALPADLAEQIRSDACRLGAVLGRMCKFARVVEVKLEIFGENVCSRWHRDNYGGRAIVSYTGAIGTQYTSDENVNMWELTHCGVNEHIILDQGQVCHAEVGDLLFMKGSRYPTGAKGLIHRSPPKRYHADGRIVERLVLKVDVPTE